MGTTLIGFKKYFLGVLWVSTTIHSRSSPSIRSTVVCSISQYSRALECDNRSRKEVQIFTGGRVAASALFFDLSE